MREYMVKTIEAARQVGLNELFLETIERKASEWVRETYYADEFRKLVVSYLRGRDWSYDTTEQIANALTVDMTDAELIA